jgi:hypothetical protein
MATHLNPEELASYAELGSRSANCEEVEMHLEECNTCLNELVQLQNMLDLDAEGLFILPSEHILTLRAGSPLQTYLEGKPGSTPKRPSKAVLGSLTGILGGVLVGHLGQPVPALGKDADPEHTQQNDPEHVRNSRSEPSSFVNEDHERTHEHDQEHGGMMTTGEITRPDPIIGTPGEDLHSFPGKQSYSDTCAIRCQEFIIRQFTGENLPEKYYVDEARQHHWYQPGEGTRLEDIGKQLEFHGIPVHRYADADILHLTAELTKGHKVIIGVDSEELWRSHPIRHEFQRAFGWTSADHAVVVSGIDTSDRDNPKIIVSDPGTGLAARYPWAQFFTAWRDSRCFMVTTQDPPPEHLHLPEMRNFDYQMGHLDHVGSLSYTEFLQLLNQESRDHEGDLSQEDHDRAEHLLRLIAGDHQHAAHGFHDSDVDLGHHDSLTHHESPTLGFDDHAGSHEDAHYEEAGGDSHDEDPADGFDDSGHHHDG